MEFEIKVKLVGDGRSFSDIPIHNVIEFEKWEDVGPYFTKLLADEPAVLELRASPVGKGCGYYQQASERYGLHREELARQRTLLAYQQETASNVRELQADALPFGAWLDVFIEKNNLDRGCVFEVNTGLNVRRVEFEELIAAMKATVSEEKALTRKLIPFQDDVMEYFKHLATRLEMEKERKRGER